MPITLFEHRTRERDRRSGEVTAWQEALVAAQAELRSSKPPAPDTIETAARKAIDAVATLDDEIADARARLEVATTPVDMNALADEIATKTRERHVALWASLDAQSALSGLEAQVDKLEGQVRASRRARDDAEIAREAARASRDAIDALKAKLAGDLATLPADAIALLGSPTFTAAEARFADAKLPAALRALAEARYDRWTAGLALGDDEASRAIDIVVALRTGDGSRAKVAALEVAYDRAHGALRDFANSGRERFDAAQSVLERIAAAEVISPEVTSALAEPSLLADREASQALALAFVTASAEAEQAQSARAAAALAVRAGDPLATDAMIDADAAVAPLVTAHDDKVAALGLADAAYSAEHRERILAWQATIPEHPWADFLDFLEARATLRAIRDAVIDPADAASLQQAFDAAEDAYASALEDEALLERALDFLAANHAELTANHQHQRTESRVRRLSALRGNGA